MKSLVCIILTALMASFLISCGYLRVFKAPKGKLSKPDLSDSIAYRSYRITLDQLATSDWQDRKSVFKVFRKYGFNSLSADSANRWLSRQDSIRLHTFQTLEQCYGWPQVHWAGTDGVQQAFLLVQHAPSQVQAGYQNILQVAHARGELSSPDYATYLDRVYINQGRLQLYGTQRGRRVLANNSEEDYLLPVEDLQQLDNRRATMQMEPILLQLRPGTLIFKSKSN